MSIFIAEVCSFVFFGLEKERVVPPIPSDSSRVIPIWVIQHVFVVFFNFECGSKFLFLCGPQGLGHLDRILSRGLPQIRQGLMIPLRLDSMKANGLMHCFVRETASEHASMHISAT